MDCTLGENVKTMGNFRKEKFQAAGFMLSAWTDEMLEKGNNGQRSFEIRQTVFKEPYLL
jgi:hypothetical protein